MKNIERVGAFFDHVMKYMYGVAGFFVIAMMLVMCYETIMRYFFRRPPAWAVEISEYTLFLIAFLGAPWLLKVKGHVNIDLVINRLNPKVQTLLNITTSAIGTIICLFITSYGVESTIDHFQRGVPVVKTLYFPKFVFLAFIPVGCFLLSIQFIRQTYTYISSWKGTKG